MTNRLYELSLTDLISLKGYLMSRENALRYTLDAEEEVRQCHERWVAVEKEIQERVKTIFK